jgi:hypothetical protein
MACERLLIVAWKVSFQFHLDKEEEQEWSLVKGEDQIEAMSRAMKEDPIKWCSKLAADLVATKGELAAAKGELAAAKGELATTKGAVEAEKRRADARAAEALATVSWLSVNPTSSMDQPGAGPRSHHRR